MHSIRTVAMPMDTVAPLLRIVDQPNAEKLAKIEATVKLTRFALASSTILTRGAIYIGRILEFLKLDPSNLRDPDRDGRDEANRMYVACYLFTCRILHALDYLKGPVKQAIANFFANKGCINRNEFPELYLLFSQ
ncbi:hypothetical protein RMATCC62417_17431 [Rhizopus microsporus]|nr:hypothetical protein RMATCC62417_17431 [Rhizopus microsporus]